MKTVKYKNGAEYKLDGETLMYKADVTDPWDEVIAFAGTPAQLNEVLTMLNATNRQQQIIFDKMCYL